MDEGERTEGASAGERRRLEVAKVEVIMPAQGRADPEPPSGANADGKEKCSDVIVCFSFHWFVLCSIYV